jgi:hypothetical protein
MKKTNTKQLDTQNTPPLKKEIFDSFLKKAIETPKIETKKKVKKK